MDCAANLRRREALTQAQRCADTSSIFVFSSVWAPNPIRYPARQPIKTEVRFADCAIDLGSRVRRPTVAPCKSREMRPVRSGRRASLACDLSQIDVCYGGEPGRGANMPVCLSLTHNRHRRPPNICEKASLTWIKCVQPFLTSKCWSDEWSTKAMAINAHVAELEGDIISWRGRLPTR